MTRWLAPLAVATTVHVTIALVPVPEPAPQDRDRLRLRLQAQTTPVDGAADRTTPPGEAAPAGDPRPSVEARESRAAPGPPAPHPVATTTTVEAPGPGNGRRGADARPVPALPSALDGLPGRAPPPPRIADTDAYAASLRASVARERRYPRRARRLRHRGTVTVMVHVSADGGLARPPVVQRSSSSMLLDAEALRMVQAAAPFAPPPGRRAVAIAIPVSFDFD